MFDAAFSSNFQAITDIFTINMSNVYGVFFFFFTLVFIQTFDCCDKHKICAKITGKINRFWSSKKSGFNSKISRICEQLSGSGTM